MLCRFAVTAKILPCCLCINFSICGMLKLSVIHQEDGIFALVFCMLDSLADMF